MAKAVRRRHVRLSFLRRTALVLLLSLPQSIDVYFAEPVEDEDTLACTDGADCWIALGDSILPMSAVDW